MQNTYHEQKQSGIVKAKSWAYLPKQSGNWVNMIYVIYKL